MTRWKEVSISCEQNVHVDWKGVWRIEKVGMSRTGMPEGYACNNNRQVHQKKHHNHNIDMKLHKKMGAEKNIEQVPHG